MKSYLYSYFNIEVKIVMTLDDFKFKLFRAFESLHKKVYVTTKKVNFFNINLF